MTTALFKDGFPSAHRTTRQRIESSIDLRRLFSAIDADPALIGAGVVYIDEDFNVLTLREFQAVCSVQVKQANRTLPKRISATEMQLATAHHVREALAAAVGFASSSMPGNIKALAIGIYEEASQ